MAPVTRTIELYRPKATEGNTLGVAADGDISGNVDGSVLTIAAGGIVATTFASGAITEASIAANAITAAKIALSAITAAKLAPNAITSSVMAANSIGASQLATDAAEEIADTVWDEVLTGATHDVVDSAGRRLRDLQEFGVYEDGAIWIDTVNGTPGTTDYENGTVFNPVNTIADANTLATSLGISRFRVAPGSSITLAASQQNQEFLGSSWTLALGGQNIDGSVFHGAVVTGIATNSTGRQEFIHCDIGTSTLPADTHLDFCGLSGTVTIGEAGDYFFDQCHSDIAGTSTPTIDTGAAIAHVNLNVRHYSGGVELQNVGASGTDNVSIEGFGQVVVNANCTGGTIVIRGLFTLTDSGSSTISDDARYDLTTILSDSTAFAGADIATILGNQGTPGSNGLAGDIAALNDLSPSEVNAEISDVLKVDTLTEPSQAAPPASGVATMEDALRYIFFALTNKQESDTGTNFLEYFDRAGATVQWKRAISDDGTINLLGSGVTGP
jgi:hypothetical protein